MSISGIIVKAERQENRDIVIEIGEGATGDPVGQRHMVILAPCNMVSEGAEIWGGGDFCRIKLDDGSWGEYERIGYTRLKQK